MFSLLKLIFKKHKGGNSVVSSMSGLCIVTSIMFLFIVVCCVCGIIFPDVLKIPFNKNDEVSVAADGDSNGSINLADFTPGTKGYWYAKMSISSGLRPGFIEAMHMVESAGAETQYYEDGDYSPFEMGMDIWNGTQGGAEESQVGVNPAKCDFNSDGKEDIASYIDSGGGFSSVCAKRLVGIKSHVSSSMGVHEQEALMAFAWNSYYDPVAGSFGKQFDDGVKSAGGDSVLAAHPMSKDDGWTALTAYVPSSLDIGGRNSTNGQSAGYYGYRAANFAEFYNKDFYTRYSTNHISGPTGGGKKGGASGTVGQVIAWEQSWIGRCWYSQDLRTQEGYFDCSSLQCRAYRACGIDIAPGSDCGNTGDEVAQGTGISADSQASWQPGDLLFYGDTGFPHHVVMYEGNGMIIEIATTGESVKEVPLTSRGDWPSVVRRYVN